MQVTSKTLYADFAPFADVLTEESDRTLKMQAEHMFKPCNALTVDEFWGVMNGDLSLLGDMKRPTVLQVYWCKRFADFCEEFTQLCERLVLPPQVDDTKASEGCVKMSPQESMLVFIRSYFGLHSFFEAGNVTVGEYLTARKDRYNEARMQRNFEKIQRAKIKAKK